MIGLLCCVVSAAGQPSTSPETKGPPPTVRTSTGPDRVNWWNDRVFYEIFVRSFADSKDGPLANDGIGDIKGLIEHLDYLNDGDPKTDTDLGIGGIWLMPIMPSPSYHGYDITDYYGVNPQYGTTDDFKALMAACHKRGINVIIDLVPNHCSNKHEWFTGAAEAGSLRHNWFIWSDTDPGWRGPWNQRVWHALPPSGPEAKEAYYYGLFSPVMPDLNFRNPAVTEEMNTVSRAWLTSMGADGFRLDAIRHLIEEGQVQENTPATHIWLRNWLQALKGVNLDAMTIGEVWADSEQASSYVGAELDMTFEFATADAMIASVKAGTKDAFVKAQKRVLELYPPNQYGRFLSNHDQTRVMTQLKGDEGAMRSAAALLLTGPGVPFIYYGEEIGMTGNKPDEHLRTPMQWNATEGAGFTTARPWAAVNKGFESLNVEKQAADPNSLLSLYKKLIRLRNEHPALATGGTWMVETDKPEIVAFLRRRETRYRPDLGPGARSAEAKPARPSIDTVLVVINLSDHAVEGCTLALDASRTQGEFAAADLVLGGAWADVTFSEKGGLSGYKPAASLLSRSVSVINLTSK